MRTGLLRSVGASAAIAAVLVVAHHTAAACAEAPLKTPWGAPDLQGIWTDENDTPFQRSPKYADQDVINPGAVIRSGALMFEFMGWPEAGDRIERSLAATIAQRRVTYDLERLMKLEGAKNVQKLGTSAFAGAIIENMQGGIR